MSIFKKILKKVTFLDLIKTPYEIKNHYNKKNGSVTGGLLTLLMIGFFTYYIIILFINSQERKTQKIN